MKTFSQFLNEGLSRNTSSVTGCDAIKKMYDFLRVNANKLFKFDRVWHLSDEHGDDHFLIYTLDKDKFERLSGIYLNSITEDDAKNKLCYNTGNKGIIHCAWEDMPHNTKWGIERWYGHGKNITDYIFIFVIDKNTKCVSTVEYALNTEYVEGDLESVEGTYVDKIDDFEDLWKVYDTRYDFKAHPNSKASGCLDIQKTYEFLDLKAVHVLKAERIEDIQGEQNLIYTLDDATFVRMSGIYLNNIPEEAVTDINCYKFNGTYRDVTGGWIDDDKTKYAIFFRNSSGRGGDIYSMIFVMDENRHVSTIEFAINTKCLKKDPESLLGDYLLNGHDYFADSCYMYDYRCCFDR